jgi:hypothetical protein
MINNYKTNFATKPFNTKYLYLAYRVSYRTFSSSFLTGINDKKTHIRPCFFGV